MTSAGFPGDGLVARTPVEADFATVQRALGAWWGDLGGQEGAQQRRLLVPRLFFQHFTATSTVVRHRAGDGEGELAAFLVGFLSQSHPHEAYIHVVGVDPALHGRGLGRGLYEWFFARVGEAGRTRVRCITGPVNVASVAFHRAMGFAVEAGPQQVDGVAVQPDYDGAGLPRVSFVREL